jgi:hypothetical protein
VAYVTALRDAGVPLVLIADVPFNPAESHVCVDDSGGSASVAASCTTPRADALDVYPDGIPTLSTDLGVPLIDLTEAFCDDSSCKVVLGNVVAYQDTPGSHLTNTLSTMLAGPLGEALDAMRATPTSR